MRGGGTSALSSTADQALGEPPRVRGVDDLPQRTVQRRPEPGRRGQPVTEEGPGTGDVEGFGEQVREEVHDDPAAAQQIRERVVLLAGAFGPEDVVEEELLHVARREPLQLHPGPVQHDLPQQPDLGPHSERRARRLRHPSSVPARACRVTPTGATSDR